LRQGRASAWPVGKLAVVTDALWFTHGRRAPAVASSNVYDGARSGFMGTDSGQITGERIGKVAREIAAADLGPATVHNRRANAKRRQQPCQLHRRQWQTVRPRTILTLGQGVDDHFAR